jgi:hypothetical protein
MGKIFTRFGDGTPTELSESELMQDLEAGTRDAAERGRIPALSTDELRHLYDIFASPYNFVSVERGNEVILTYDAGTLKIRRVGVAVDRIQALQIYEKIMGADTMELCHVDYSFKPLKPIITMEQPVLEQALLSTHIPLFYGAMPNLGIYSQPDGPFPNPAELMPAGKIEAAKELAGLYPHDQLKLAEKAGVTIFGPVVNTNTTESSPWNVARATTFIKAAGEIASIALHPNMGMGVGGVPVCDHPPIDIVSRASKAMVEICRLDGL